MKKGVVIYARTSTSDKNQDPETQLLPLRDYCRANDWEIFKEYVDTASARDLVHRTGWRELLDDCAKRKCKVVVVFKLDRAFRSVKDMHDTLAVWELLGVEFRSLREQFETSTAVGRLLLNLLAAVAEFELEMIRERVKAGMDRARRQGKRIGRPSVSSTALLVKKRIGRPTGPRLLITTLLTALEGTMKGSTSELSP